MKLKFRDLYATVQETKQAVVSMGLDISNVLNGEGKCLLAEEHMRLIESYKDLYNADIKLNENITEIRRKVDLCIQCIDIHP
ncbi:hypothetical protein [Paenibacillus arenosi]|uniref:Uncharacterized protein n=1 Tax=Paenibacillus arenosi TaxID=2774142 RepID=A0ABR9B108_9BACL|nr:hypothetical protein [Paenibacillus arenosi]MBD8498861.1 hypothetical protein [Paenibacillus arenosi]